MKVTVKKKDNSIPVSITTEFIKLQDAMKFANIVYSGGEAKALIQEGEVTVNGEVLPKSYYTIEETAENTVVVTLKESYLKTLKTGEYTISVESYQGNVETTLSVTNDTPIYGNGDSTSWMLLVATLSLAGVVFATKKRRCTK